MSTNIGVPNVSVFNSRGYSYLFGNDNTDGSIRFSSESDIGDAIFEIKISGVWQPASMEVSTGTIYFGPRVGAGAFGHHLLTEDTLANHSHLHGHNVFDGELTTLDARIIRATSYVEDFPVQTDFSGEITTSLFEFNTTSTFNSAFKTFKFKTSSTAPTDFVRIQVWQNDSSGPVVLNQKYPASDFVSDSDISLNINGWLQLDEGLTYLIRVSSSSDFSLKTNAAEDFPYLLINVSAIQEDDMLEVNPYVDGNAIIKEAWRIQNRKIYQSNNDITLTGDFNSNLKYFNELSPFIFSWEELPSTQDLLIPLNHQMTTHGTFTMEGDLNLEGTLVLRN